MRRIDKQEAKRLIGTGAAGWYAVDANPPIPHATQIVYSSGTGEYLCTTAEINITLHPLPALVGGTLKQLFNIEVPDDSPVIALLQQDIAAQRQIDVGGELPTFHTGDRQGP